MAGAMQTAAGEMPATGRTVSLPFVTAFQVRGDRITQHHAYWDQMTFLVQLGLVPEGPPSA
jgi:carboxymethylenebutenolidase